ncbi:hypothetical protein SpAn4DRAFT_4702 [Sporomusa ovata]|uniref:Uncharacterized protein n=1 Tax=Sporomusa ovata TaxID=2378 RepID=A0A0U1KRY5_9FIRM|nr:hypothetical protein SpAn4DRAFT_4702 [Sporomusa ovata]
MGRNVCMKQYSGFYYYFRPPTIAALGVAEKNYKMHLF